MSPLIFRLRWHAEYNRLTISKSVLIKPGVDNRVTMVMVDDAREEGRCGGRRLDQLSRGQASPTGRWRMSHVASVCGRDAVRGGRVCGGMRDLDEGGGTMSMVRATICQGHIKEAGAGGAGTGGRVHLRTAGARRARAGLPWPAVVVAAPDLKTCAGMKIDENKIGWSRTV